MATHEPKLVAEEFEFLAKFPPVLLENGHRTLSDVSKYREELELLPGALGWRHTCRWISRIINLC